ncbi:hypothetical protein AAG570_005165, partial [Ranatra chinensis]
VEQGLRSNSSLEKLSLVHCPIGDGGCCTICDALKDRMNLVHLEFTDCSLTHKGAKHISELIKCQKLSRFEETWRNSLRYREVDSNQLAGLRRLTVNNNKDIGDAGFKEIVDVLYDDLWLKGSRFYGKKIPLSMKLSNQDSNQFRSKLENYPNQHAKTSEINANKMDLNNKLREYKQFNTSVPLPTQLWRIETIKINRIITGHSYITHKDILNDKNPPNCNHCQIQ